MTDPEVLSSGPAGRRSRGRLAGSAAPVLVTALVMGSAGGYAGYRIGRDGRDIRVLAPDTGVRLAAADWFGGSQDPPRRRAVVQINVTNRGGRPVLVLAAGTDHPGLTLLGAEFVVASGVRRDSPAPPFPLEPGGTAGVVLSYRVGDCDAARSGRLALPVRVELGSRTRTVDVAGDPTYRDGWQSGFLTSICPASG